MSTPTKEEFASALAPLNALAVSITKLSALVDAIDRTAVVPPIVPPVITPPSATPFMVNLVTYPDLATAVAVLKDGDTLTVAPGKYRNQVAHFTASGILIRCPTPRGASFDAAGNSSGGKATLVLSGNDYTVDGLEGFGSVVGDNNGAFIKLEGRNLILRNCYIHHNQDGLLTGTAQPLSDILIEDCEFAFNGDGSGQTHNVYIGNHRSLTLNRVN